MTATAEKTRSAFRQSCSIRCDIAAPAERVWALLTDAAHFPDWNSTVTSITGTIAAGQQLAIRVPLDPKRTFKPKVTKLTAHEMVWSDGFAPMFRGVRTFVVGAAPDGKTTRFAMTETFSGLMLPMIRGSLPDFGPAFETYAADLKRAAEKS